MGRVGEGRRGKEMDGYPLTPVIALDSTIQYIHSMLGMLVHL
jgi:hypothetical protein